MEINFLTQEEIKYLKKENIFFSDKCPLNDVYIIEAFYKKKDFLDLLMKYKIKNKCDNIKVIIRDIEKDWNIWRQIVFKIKECNKKIEL